MRRLTTVLLAGILLFASIAYAGNGDLIVDHKVGIGNDAPQASLDLGGVNRSSDYHVSFLWYNDNNTGPYAGTKGGIYLDQWGLPNNTTVVFPTAADNPGTFIVATKDTGGTSLVERVRIQGQTGNVGIGTASPYAKLSVNASSQTEYAGTDGGYIGSNLVLQGTDSGRTVGKGASLTFALPANTDGSNVWEQARILATPDNTNNGDARGRLYLQVRDLYNPGTGGTWNWRTGLMVQSNGNTGIGTTAPTQKLDVQGLVASNGTVLTSDARFKKNLLPISSPIDKILKLKGLSYEWKTDEYKDKGFSEGRHYGVIAQDIEKVLPEVVTTNAKGEKSVAYTEIIPVMIEAVKDQQKLIEKQQEIIKNQQKMLETQQAELLEIRMLVRNR